MSLSRRVAVSCCLGFTLFALGCGEADARKMATIKGKVTVGGQPVKPPDGGKITLSFKPKSGERPESIDLKADGTYEGKAVTGENAVTLIVYGQNEMGPAAAAKLGIKDQYTSDAMTPLKANVGKDATADFEVGQ